MDYVTAVKTKPIPTPEGSVHATDLESSLIKELSRVTKQQDNKKLQAAAFIWERLRIY